MDGVRTYFKKSFLHREIAEKFFAWHEPTCSKKSFPSAFAASGQPSMEILDEGPLNLADYS